MSKLYILCSIVFCNTAFVLCMQKERYMPVVLYPSHTSYVTTTPKYPVQNRIINTATQTGWETLNAIMEAPYTSNIQPVISHPCTMTVPKREEKDSKKRLEEINKTLDRATFEEAEQHNRLVSLDLFTQLQNERMQKLYNKTHSLFKNYCTKPQYSRVDDGVAFISRTNDCINGYDEAKKYGISEDIMGEFAFRLSEKSFDHRCKVALFFGLLKMYNKSILTEDGKTSSSLYYQVSPLARSLNLVTDDVIEQQLTCTMAMKSLMNDLSKINNKGKILSDFVSFLYSGKKFEEKKNDFKSVVVGADWERDFLYKTFAFLNFYYTLDYDVLENNLLYLIDLIKEAKRSGFIATERDLGYYALQYKATALDSVWMWPIETSYDSQKGNISLICVLIEQYLKTTKITPSQQDYDYYNIANELSISFPDGFDQRLLNSDYVAFKEYKKLWQDILHLKQASSNVVQECVQLLYPPKSKLTSISTT